MKYHKETIFIFPLLLAVFTAGCSSTVGLEQLANTAQGQEEFPISSEAATPTNPISTQAVNFSYHIVNTGQEYCYENGASIPCPNEDEPFYGQDAQYNSTQPSYTNNGDGTITDNLTGLMWQQDPGDKMTFDQAVTGAESFNLAGYDDWRLPTIKELYSLILFSGVDPSGCDTVADCPGIEPFIDTNYFIFEYGNTNAGERVIDSQFATSTKYVSTTMVGNDTDFGVNFADGRIKGYPTGPMLGQSSGKLFFVLYLRGNPDYGVNDFIDNGDGTISDQATGLIWMQNDSGSGMIWEDALNFCESLGYAGSEDWRLPNVKELQSIVDYSRSPDTTNSAAIDPIFKVTTITNEAGETDYPFYWSSTTHGNTVSGGSANYVSFGRALGYMNGSWLDVHGAGAQRSDPKSGDPAEYSTGHGPQGDAIRIYNYARCVCGGINNSIFTGGELDPNIGSGSFPSDSGSEQSGNQPGGQPGVGGAPPQKAIDACTGLSEGAVCSMITPEGTLSGNCTYIQSKLACLPKGSGPVGNQ